MNIETKTLTAALNVIAGFFTESMTTADGEIVNQLAYPQEKILNGICYATVQQIQYTRGTALATAMTEMKAAVEEHRGDEVSDRRLARKVQRVQDLNYQLAHLDAFETEALDAYKRATGKAYQHRTANSSGGGVKPSDALAMAQAMLGAAKAPATDYNSTQAAGDNAQTVAPGKKRA